MQNDTVVEVGSDHYPWDVYILKSTDGHGRTLELKCDADHVSKVDLEDRSVAESHHEDHKSVEEHHECHDVLENHHQCNSVHE